MSINLFSAFPSSGTPNVIGFAVVTRDVQVLYPYFVNGIESGTRILLSSGIPHGTSPNGFITPMLWPDVVTQLTTDDPSLAFFPVITTDGTLAIVEEDAPFLIGLTTLPLTTLTLYLRVPVVGPNLILRIAGLATPSVMSETVEGRHPDVRRLPQLTMPKAWARAAAAASTWATSEGPR